MNADAAAQCAADDHEWEEIVTMSGKVVALICMYCGHRERTDP